MKVLGARAATGKLVVLVADVVVDVEVAEDLLPGGAMAVVGVDVGVAWRMGGVGMTVLRGGMKEEEGGEGGRE